MANAQLPGAAWVSGRTELISSAGQGWYSANDLGVSILSAVERFKSWQIGL